jgi:methylamine---glutamate N-methyltransferase subunit A
MAHVVAERHACDMCGIAALFAKTQDVELALGAHLSVMLEQLADRGPDSSGVAFYCKPLAAGSTKLSLLSPVGPIEWSAVAARLEAAFGSSEVLIDHVDHAVVQVDALGDDVRAWLSEHAPGISVLSSGQAIELHKRVGAPGDLIAGCGLAGISATHALGHTRMATESNVTTAGSHPFSTGEDLCLVHNGSLSNHNALRRTLRRHGVRFQTENDSEVAAGYLMWRLRSGDTLEQALTAALDDIDGFYTFAVGTRDGFAVLRDPIACKPAILAETDEWVAMGSEYRALAVLPAAETATVWEPAPGRVYSWSRTEVLA